jgi:hypothetical protein
MNAENTMTERQSTDFENAIALLAVLTEATNRLNELENDANDQLMELLDDKLREYAQLQETITKSDTALELLALKHPEWFKLKKSIKTPFGVMRFHSSTKLEVSNEEATLAKLELMEAKDREGAFRASLYTREEKTLNIEALEKLDDATLLRLGINRVKDEKFTATPAKLEMGKAIQAAAEAEEKKEAA